MKKTLFIIALLMLVKTQAQTDCHIKDYWKKIFVLDTNVYKQKVYYFIDVKRLSENHKCASKINPRFLELDYIRSNFTDFKNKKEILIKITDSVKRQQKLIDLLQKDSLFMHTITSLGDAWQQKYKKDTVTINTLMDIAAHYFYLNKQTSEGYLGGHVCVGINALNALQTNRKPLIELFVFKTIFDNYTGETSQDKYNMHDEFINAVKEIYKIDLGKIDEKRLHLAQGAMLMYMFHNEALKSLITDAYEKQKDSLPFVLINK